MKSNQKICFCKACFNPIEPISCNRLIKTHPTLCLKCFKHFNPILNHSKLLGHNVFAIYPYDDFVKTNLYKLKGCYDIELAPIFLEYYEIYLNIRYFGYIVIPAPSYIESDKARGFNHVQEIFKTLKLKQYPCIKKTKNVKQADLHFHERQNIKDALEFDDKYDIKNKKVLLVDDVFTTGSTMKAMIELVKPRNPKRIEILVMSMVSNKNDRK